MSQTPSDPKKDGPVNPEVFREWFTTFRKDPNDNPTYEEFMERAERALKKYEAENERLKQERGAREQADPEPES